SSRSSWTRTPSVRVISWSRAMPRQAQGRRPPSSLAATSSPPRRASGAPLSDARLPSRRVAAPPLTISLRAGHALVTGFSLHTGTLCMTREPTERGSDEPDCHHPGGPALSLDGVRDLEARDPEKPRPSRVRDAAGGGLRARQAAGHGLRDDHRS